MIQKKNLRTSIWEYFIHLMSCVEVAEWGSFQLQKHLQLITFFWEIEKLLQAPIQKIEKEREQKAKHF